MLAPAVAEAKLIANLPVVATAADTKPVFVAVEVPYKVKPMSKVGVVPPVAAQIAWISTTTAPAGKITSAEFVEETDTAVPAASAPEI
jgi:hypothetical protein